MRLSTSDFFSESKGNVVPSYIHGTSEKHKRVFWNTASTHPLSPTRPIRPLRQTWHKRHLRPHLPHAVWWTGKPKCSKGFIGKTEHKRKARLLEHRRPSSLSSKVSSPIHDFSPGHVTSLDNVKVLDREPSLFERGVKGLSTPVHWNRYMFWTGTGAGTSSPTSGIER